MFSATCTAFTSIISLSLLLQTTLASYPPPSYGSNPYHINWKPANSPSITEYIYPGTGLDGPKVKPVNTTTYDWWYFDAVSSDLPQGDLSSLVIVFYDATPGGFAALTNTTTKLDVGLSGSFKNGTIFTVDAFPHNAVVFTNGDSSSGTWGSYGSWTGSTDLKTWTIRFQDDTYGISGTMQMQSIAPPHLPCGAVKKGATEVILPGVGWSNAVPDAHATVDFNIDGSSLQFTGVGYHDKNWGSSPFFNNVASWYWGHGRLGEDYSIVWFDALDYAGTEYLSAYVAKDGEILAGSCQPGSVLVRPWGGEDAYPPPPNKKIPKGFEVTFGNVDGKQMVVNVTISETVIPYKGVYDRFIGTMKGGFTGGEQLTGVATFEQFKV